MRLSVSRFHAVPLISLFAAVLCSTGTASSAQNSDFKLELHANKNVGAAQIGLPDYPGATLAKETDDDSTADLGFTLGDTHFRLLVAKYVIADSPDRVLAFYRKPLARYGEVLECNRGKPVGDLTVVHSGLTCSGQKEGGLALTDHGLSSDGHELRAGSPHQFRIVCIDESHRQPTHFWLVYIELPKDNDKTEKPK